MGYPEELNEDEEQRLLDEDEDEDDEEYDLDEDDTDIDMKPVMVEANLVPSFSDDEDELSPDDE